jgi:ABC-2 type transport system ATP-binding protein
MLWGIVTGVHKEFGVTVLLTTHYIEEADALCDRIAIIDRGRILAEGTPSELKARVQGDVVQLEVAGDVAAAELSALPGVQEVRAQGNVWVLHVASSEAFLPRLLTKFPPSVIRRISVEKPSLETVFLDVTGRRIGEEEPIRDVRRFYAQMQRARQ